MKIKSLKLSIAILFCIITNLSSQTNVEIKGKTINNNGFYTASIDDLILSKIIVTDSIKNNIFNLKLTVEKTNIYKLHFGAELNTYIMLILSPGEKVSVTINFADIQNPEVEGSPDTKLIYSTINGMKNFDKMLADYTKKMEEDKLNFIKNTLKSNSSSMASLFYIDNIDIQKNMDIYEKVLGDLNKKYPGSPFLGELNNKINETKFLQTGSEAPDINFPNTEGKSIALSSLRGKYVLIDFWASWCGPCRMNNPHLVKMYEKYKKDNFEVYGVSFDKSKDNWVKAIEADKLTWINVSDLKYWESAAAKLYGVTGIPYSVLIDPQGRIIGKGLRGDDLEKKLIEIFKK